MRGPRRGQALSAVAWICVLLSSCRHAPPATVVSGSAPSAAVKRLGTDIDRILSEPALEHASWGIVVRSLESDQILYSINPHKLLLPGSNLKIVTLAAAAERLGWDFAYETRIYAAGPIADGVLAGDLLVVGDGDPSIDDWDG